MTTINSRHLTLVAAAAVLMLGACSRSDDATVGQKVDEAVVVTERKTDELSTEARKAMDDAKAASERAAAQAGQAVERATDTLGQKVTDAAVTASITAELAKDPDLSALRIDVDTSDGEVVLSGTAPDAGARDRATRLAAAVKGVTRVDNRIQVGG